MGKTLLAKRCLLVNPFLEPTDLRAEVQSIDGENTHESALNYGLLVVASSLAKTGCKVEIVDLEHRRRDWEMALDAAVASADPQWIGIGTLSVYSFLPMMAILRRCRDVYKGVKTVIGGQNAQNIPALLDRLGEIELVDYLVCGDGEHAVLEIADAVANNQQPHAEGVTCLRIGDKAFGQFARRMPLDAESSFLCYDLYPNYRQFWPVIEESRGCPFHCDFCANATQGGASINYKRPELLIAELQRIYDMYGRPSEMPLVLMTSIFGANPRLTREFFTQLADTDLRPQFIASTRVDLNYESYIDLVPAYFDQMHFGLETGSPRVLASMQKANAPELYLQRASASLKAWHDRGVHTAVNFIAGYVGETHDTVEESIEFLRSHRKHIDSAWGGGLIAYPDSPFVRQFDSARVAFGSRLELVSKYCDLLQTYPVTPSSTFSYSEVLDCVDMVHRMFYDPERYYHHYKWYMGPQLGQTSPVFIPRDEFERRFRLKVSVLPGTPLPKGESSDNVGSVEK